MIDPRVLVLLAALVVPTAAGADTRATSEVAACDGDPVCLAGSFADVIATTKDRLELPRLVEFPPGRVRVYSESREKLARVAKLWRASIGWATITIDGYAYTARRSPAENLALSRRRAERIRDYLVRYGVDPAFVVVEGHPAAGGTDGGPARHVDLVITRCLRSEAECRPAASISAH